MGAKLLLPNPLLTVLHIFTNFHLKFSPSRLHAIRELRARFLAFRNGHLSLLRATATSKGTWNQSDIPKESLLEEERCSSSFEKILRFFRRSSEYALHCIHRVLEIHVSLCLPARHGVGHGLSAPRFPETGATILYLDLKIYMYLTYDHLTIDLK